MGWLSIKVADSGREEVVFEVERWNGLSMENRIQGEHEHPQVA